MLNTALKHRPRRWTALAALAAAGVTSVAVAAPVVAQSANSGRTIRFHEINKGSRFAYIDNPPRNSKHSRPVFSAGDQIVIGTTLANASGKIGELRATCTMTKTAPAPRGNSINAGHPYCAGAFVTKKGTLFAQAVDAGAKTTRGAIVGGTGAYVGAQGTFTSTATKTGNNDVVKLSR